MVDATLTRRRRQTEKAREASLARFSTPEEKSEHYAALGQRSGDRRLTLSGPESEALARAYELLAKIASRHPKLAAPPPDTSVTDDGSGSPGSDADEPDAPSPPGQASAA